MIKIKSLLLSGVGVSIAVLIGRLFGFLREILIASIFGKSYAADVATLSLMVPDTIANFLLGGAFSSAFMPALLHSSKSKRIKLVYNIHFLLGLVFVLFTFLFYLYSEQIAFFIAEKMPIDDKIKLSHLIGLSAWSIPFIVFSAILTAYLNSKHLFFFPALGASLVNICICVSLLMFPVLKFDAQYLMAISIIVGSIVRWVFQFYPIFSYRAFSSACKWGSIVSNTIEIKYIKKYVHAFFATASMVLLPILSRYYMLQTGDGQLANLSYAQKIADLFVTIVSGSVITVLMPRIIKNNDRFKYINYSFIVIFLFSCVISLFLNTYSETISRVLFGRGAFDNTAILSLSKHIELISYIIPFYSSVFFLTGTLAVTDLSSKNVTSTLLGLIVFIFCIYMHGQEGVKYSDVYHYILVGYASILIMQFLFIFQHERKSNAKAYVYH